MSRLFVAIDLPKILKKMISMEIIEKLSGVKKTPEKNLHITLCFIGEADEKKTIEKLSKIGFQKFRIELNGIGKFGERVIWVETKSEEMKVLAEKISKTLGIKEEGGFSGHLTIARAKKNQNPSVFLKEIEKIKDKKIGKKFLAEKFVLMKSELLPEGPVYSQLKEFSAEVL
ncbi:MAG: RNA 2',3'-cyclic phosphodiesterase [Candidatus Diapherotrites archaeon]|nr:RNA 2',3'-cyclic phosphodiesterase [Candidatus Diapherotrites archaeon]